MTDVFVLGAGFSRAISDHMPLMQDIRILDLAVEYMGGGYSIAGPPGINALTNDTFERYMTYLAADHPWLSAAQNYMNRGNFLLVADALARMILDKQNATLRADQVPDWLRMLLAKWRSERSVVLTFNYDTLVEKAFTEEADTSQYAMGDLYPVPITSVFSRRGAVLTSGAESPFSLLKLHGSINWYYSGSARFYGEAIFDVGLKRGWATDTQDALEDIQARTLDKVPFIVPPTLEKTQFFENETVRAQWTIASHAVTRAERVYFLGYSFPDTDTTSRFLFGPACSGKEVHVVNMDPEAPNRYANILIDSRIEGSFAGAGEPIAAFVATLD